jgi:broad specificity phosphatase PhoE
MKTLQFMFMRHGQTDNNEAGRVTGRLDVPLNDTGREQAQKAAHNILQFPADRIPKIIIHTGMVRARETAEIMQRVLVDNGVSVRIEQDEGLKDRDLGEWEGQLWEEAPPGEKLTRNELRMARQFPANSETDAQLQARMEEAIARCLAQPSLGPGLPLLIWHGGIERMFMRAYGLGKGDKKLENAKIRCLYRDDEGQFQLEE